MPAFETATGIPFGTVNLRSGVPKGETPVSSLAGAGSLSLEVIGSNRIDRIGSKGDGGWLALRRDR